MGNRHSVIVGWAGPLPLSGLLALCFQGGRCARAHGPRLCEAIISCLRLGSLKLSFFFFFVYPVECFKGKTRLLQLQTDYFGGVPAPSPYTNRKPARLLGCTARPFTSPEQKLHCPHSDGGPLGSAFSCPGEKPTCWGKPALRIAYGWVVLAVSKTWVFKHSRRFDNAVWPSPPARPLGGRPCVLHSVCFPFLYSVHFLFLHSLLLSS